MSRISKGSEEWEKLTSGAGAKPSVWLENSFPEGSVEKWQAFLFMPGLGFYPEGNTKLLKDYRQGSHILIFILGRLLW